jgi:hypothetical protein
MSFTFASTYPAPPESPIEQRQKPVVGWQDSLATLDTWLVEVYEYRPDDTTVGTALLEAYVRPYASNTNAAKIDISEYIEHVGQDGPYSADRTKNYAFPAAEEVCVFSNATRGYQFQIYSVNNGVKSAVQGTFNYIPMSFAKRQKWAGFRYRDIFDYYPVSATSKGWLTDREVNTWIRYDMAAQDQGVVNALYLGNYDYVYQGDDNTNEASWDTVRYTVYEGLTQQNVLNLSKDTDANDFGEATHTIPIGPANIADDVNWATTYDISTEAWDYIEIRLLDSTDSDAQKSRAIRVYRDCRPQKHTPAQLYWVGTKGAEILRFDGRVNDTYDVSGRESYQVVGEYADVGAGTIDDRKTYVPEFLQQEAEGKRSFSLSEDFFTNAERELFKSAVTATHMMVRYEDQWYPCSLKTTNYTHVQASSRLAPIRLEVEVSQALRC